MTGRMIMISEIHGEECRRSDRSAHGIRTSCRRRPSSFAGFAHDFTSGTGNSERAQVRRIARLSGNRWGSMSDDRGEDKRFTTGIKSGRSADRSRRPRSGPTGGAAAVATVGLTSQPFMLMQVLFMAMNTGTTILVFRAFGAGESMKQPGLRGKPLR